MISLLNADCDQHDSFYILCGSILASEDGYMVYWPAAKFPTNCGQPIQYEWNV